MEDRLRVGVITSAHGIQGEVNVYPTTDDPARFRRLKKVYLESSRGLTETEVESVKYFKNMVILKFRDYNDRNMAESLKNFNILVDRADAEPLKEGEHFICDIIGYEVVSDEGAKIGQLEDVIETGANGVLSVRSPEGRELLIPFIKDCILNIDDAAGLITVHVLKGLFD